MPRIKYFSYQKKATFATPKTNNYYNTLAIEVTNQEQTSTRINMAVLNQFCKFRLASLVVFSAGICFAIASKDMNWTKFWILIAGGFLVTGSSNGFNQIIERDLDKLMLRTQNRPLPAGKMTLSQAYIIAFVMGIIGIAMLWLYVNPLCGMLGTIALLLYTVVYTPMKQQTPFAVFVGAFPGAIPPMLGWVAATGHISIEAIIMFAVQFMWQFPHFWAIAWMLDDDYKRAGFQMLPSNGGRNKNTAFQVLIYTLCLIPVSTMPYVFNISGTISVYVIIIIGCAFTYQAIKLYRTCSMEAAKQLMFGSFFYLPLVQIAMLLDKV